MESDKLTVRLRWHSSPSPALKVFRAETSPLANGSAFPTISVIALGVNDPDRNLLIEASVQHKWKMQFSVTCYEAWTMFEQTKAPIIVCDRDIEGAEWRDVMKMMASSTHGACAILLSRVVDDYLWNEVIANGGYDVVPKPFGKKMSLAPCGSLGRIGVV